MANPFESGSASFSDFIREQIKDMGLDEVLNLNLNGRGQGKDLATVRMTVRYVSKGLDFKLMTRTDDEGGLWVKRVD